MYKRQTVLGVLNYADDSSVRQLLSAVRDVYKRQILYRVTSWELLIMKMKYWKRLITLRVKAIIKP